MLKRIWSFVLYFIIQIDRVVDHGARLATGLPMAKRSEITPNIFLGGQYKLNSVTRLKKLGVSAVVNMREKSIHKTPKTDDFRILHLPIPDKQAPSLKQLKKGARFIEAEVKSGGKVYVHCRWGEERGATMVIAYLIWTGLTFEDAFKLVKKTRTFINPVPAQIERLREFEKISQKE